MPEIEETEYHECDWPNYSTQLWSIAASLWFIAGVLLAS